MASVASIHIFSGQVMGASQTWSAAPTSSAWALAANWAGNAIPGTTSSGTNADFATFNTALSSGIGGSSNPIVIDSGRAVAAVLFDTNAGAFVLGTNGGNALNLDATAGGNATQILATDTSGNAESIAAPIDFREPSSTNGLYNFTNNATSTAATLTLFTLNSTGTTRPVAINLNGSNTGNNTVTSVNQNGNSGAVQLTKSGAGRWIISGASALTQITDVLAASVSISGGTLEVQNANSLGTVTTPVIGGGTLEMDGVTLANTSFALNNGGTVLENGSSSINAVVVSTAAATVGTFSTVSASNVLTVGNAANKLTGGASDTVLHISGPGEVLLNNASTYAGTYSIDNGNLQLGAASATALGPITSAAVTFGASSTGTLTLNGNNTTVIGLTTNATPGTAVVQNNLTGTAVLTVNNTPANTFAGILQDGAAGTLALTHSGIGNLNLISASTYSGATSLTGTGTVTLLGASAGLGNTAITAGSGTSIVLSNTVAATNNNIGTTGASLNLNQGSTLNLQDSTIDSLTLNSTVAGGTGQVFTVGGATSTASLMFDLNDTTSDLLTINNGTTGFGTIGGKIFLKDLNSLTPTATSYTLISDPNGGLAVGTSGFTLGTPSVGINGATYVASLASSTSTAIILTLTQQSVEYYYTGNNSASWSTAGNFATDHTGATPAGVPVAGANVYLTADAPNANYTAQTLDASFSLNSLTFTSTAASPITLASGTGGSASTLTISASNPFMAVVGAGPTSTAYAAGIGIVTQANSGGGTISAPVVLGGTQTWEIDGGSLSVTGGVSDGGANYALTKTGSGDLTLSTTVNSYGGGTTVNGGTLQLGSNSTSGPNGGLGLITGNLTVTSGTLDLSGTSQGVGNLSGVGGTIVSNSNTNGTLTVGNGTSNAFGGVYQGIIADNNNGGTTTGILAFTKIGTGSMTLGGADTYSGLTSVSAGTLIAASNSAFGNSASANGGLLMSGTGTVNFTSLAPAIASLAGATTDTVNLGSTSGAGAATTLTVGGGGTTTTFAGAINDGTGTTSTAVGSLTVSGGSLTLSGSDNFTGQTIVSGGNLVITNTNALFRSTLNYNNQGGVFTFGPALTTATFAGLTGAEGLALNNTAATPVGVALTVGNNNVSSTFTGLLSGAGSLTKTGTGGNGTFQVGSGATGGATFTGAITVNAGTLIFGGVTNANLGANTITSSSSGGNCVLTLQDSAIITTTGAFTAETSSNTGTSTILLKGTSFLTIGSFAFGNNSAVFGTGQSFTVQDTATLDDVGTFDLNDDNPGTTTGTTDTLNIGNGTGTGTVEVRNIITSNGSTTHASTISFDGGTLEPTANDSTLGGGGSAVFLPALTGLTAKVLTAEPINVNTNGFNVTIAQALTGVAGDLGVVKTGAGTLALTAANSFFGGANLKGGTLQINGINALGGANYSGTTFNGGTLQYAAGFTGNGSGDITANTAAVAKPVTLTGAGTIDTNGNAISYANTVGASGTGALTIANSGTAGTGTLTLFAAATYTGATTINSGAVLQLGDGTTGHDGTIATSSGITDNGTLIYNRFAAQATSLVIQGAGAVTVSGPGSQTFTNANTYSGVTTINSGATMQLGDGTTDGSITNTNSVVDNGTLVYNLAQADRAPGYAISGSTGNVTLNGSHTLILASANTYGGTTTINSGKLRLTNATGSATGTSAVNASGGINSTLSGTGIATGAVTVTNNSRIAPGVNTVDADGSGHTNFGGVGTLSLGTLGGLTLTAANLDLDLGATGNSGGAAAAGDDTIATGGALTLAGLAVNINETNTGNGATTLDTNTNYILISGASSVAVAGSTITVASNVFSGITTSFIGSENYTATYSTSGTDLEVSFVDAGPTPEPGSLSLLVVGGLGLLRRRRKATKAGASV